MAQGAFSGLSVATMGNQARARIGLIDELHEHKQTPSSK